MTNFEKVLEFHTIFGSFTGSFKDPKFPPENVQKLRLDLIEEELQELKDALVDKNLIETIDALGDLLYVCYGALISFGVDADKVFSEIHESNMSKLDAKGKVIRRIDGKILKSKLFRQPDIAKILEAQK